MSGIDELVVYILMYTVIMLSAASQGNFVRDEKCGVLTESNIYLPLPETSYSNERFPNTDHVNGSLHLSICHNTTLLLTLYANETKVARSLNALAICISIKSSFSGELIHEMCFTPNVSWLRDVKQLDCSMTLHNSRNIVIHSMATLSNGQQTEQLYGELYTPSLHLLDIGCPLPGYNSCPSTAVRLAEIVSFICQDSSVLTHASSVDIQNISFKHKDYKPISMTINKNRVNATVTEFSMTCMYDGPGKLERKRHYLTSFCTILDTSLDSYQAEKTILNSHIGSSNMAFSAEYSSKCTSNVQYNHDMTNISSSVSITTMTTTTTTSISTPTTDSVEPFYVFVIFGVVTMLSMTAIIVILIVVIQNREFFVKRCRKSRGRPVTNPPINIEEGVSLQSHHPLHPINSSQTTETVCTETLLKTIESMSSTDEAYQPNGGATAAMEPSINNESSCGRTRTNSGRSHASSNVSFNLPTKTSNGAGPKPKTLRKMHKSLTYAMLETMGEHSNSVLLLPLPYDQFTRDIIDILKTVLTADGGIPSHSCFDPEVHTVYMKDKSGWIQETLEDSNKIVIFVCLTALPNEQKGDCIIYNLLDQCKIDKSKPSSHVVFLHLTDHIKNLDNKYHGADIHVKHKNAYESFLSAVLQACGHDVEDDKTILKKMMTGKTSKHFFDKIGHKM